MTTDTNQPSDAEKQWTYFADFGHKGDELYAIFDNEGDPYCGVPTECIAKEICDRFNELDRIKQAVDVVSDEEIIKDFEYQCVHDPDLSPNQMQLLMVGFEKGTKEMRDKLSPVIAALRERLLIEKNHAETEREHFGEVIEKAEEYAKADAAYIATLNDQIAAQQSELSRLRAENERLRDILNETDEMLAQMEDYTHGTDGDRITITRGIINNALTPPSDAGKH